VIKRWKCNVVYSNTVTVPEGALAAWLAGIPHIWHLHEFGLEDQGLSFVFGKKLSLYMVDRLSRLCVCVSNALATHYAVNVAAAKLRVIYPSMHSVTGRLPCSSKLGAMPANKRFQCAIVGALMEGKGQAEGVIAFAHLQRSGVDAELLIVGEGLPNYRDQLEELVKKNHLDQRVRFVGQVDDASLIMGHADAVLVCSQSEAFGRVTVEAMFAAKPVIGARSGATPELIEDGVNGLLYEQGNPADLAAKIECLCRNRGTALKMGENGYCRARVLFTHERYSGELMSVFEVAVPSASPGCNSEPAA
jgi:glycosyltransferase involved in cell wall biosynthesis